jgi:hypothetical protein
MASKIQALKDTVVQQNSVVVQLRKDKQDTHEALNGLVTSLVKYKPQFTAQATIVEDTQYPDIRNEDLINLSKPELLRKVTAVIMAVAQSLEASRNEIRSIYRELDTDVDDALSTWQTLAAQENKDKKAEFFRETTVKQASVPRAATPEAPMAAVNPPASTTPTRPAPILTPATTPPQEKGASKKSSTTRTLADVLSPKASTPTANGKVKK